MKVRQMFTLLTAVFSSGAFGAGDESSMSDWQLTLALNPPGYILEIEEEKERVWILQGLYDDDVERVLDQEFERIDHMMFIQTRHRAPSGEVWIDEEGCD